jgi:hypothetical protein
MMILPFLIVLCLVLFVFFLFRTTVTADLPCDIRQDGFWLRPGSARKGERLHLRWLDQKGKWHDEHIVFHPGPKGQFVPTQRRPLQIKVVQPQSYTSDSSSPSSSSSSPFSHQDSWSSSSHHHSSSSHHHSSSSSSSSSDSYTQAAAWESTSSAPAVDAQSLSDAAPSSSSDSSYPSAY